MQVSRTPEQDAALVGWGVRVAFLAVSDAQGAEAIAQRLAGMGGRVERFDETFEALGAVIDDPAGYNLLVVLCDGLGGLDAGTRAFGLLGAQRERLPVILVGSDCGEQTFPETRDAPVRLRAPLSAAALRLGFEHALRERLFWAAA